jgi:4-amino-4-deoxy-L-arabinose transferase-like glycosyltransferase
MFKLFGKHYLALLFIFFYTCLLAYKLISFPTPFFDWDESLYIENGREMIGRAYFLAPLWQGKVWLDKPPFTPLLFGLVQLLPFAPEVTVRLFVLLVSALILWFVYFFYYRLTKNTAVSWLTIVSLAFCPIFLQRAQVASLDIFLLLGWYGYFLFIDNFYLSTFFAFLSVQSKSLLGFYPILIYLGLLLLQKLTQQLNSQELKHKLINLGKQVVLLSLWYLLMFIVFGKEFYTAHIIESHFKRVTASIESHFGQRLFYVTLLFEQLGVLIYPMITGLLLILFNLLRSLKSLGQHFTSPTPSQGRSPTADVLKSKRQTSLLHPTSHILHPSSHPSLLTTSYYLLFFVPWFVFLNLTKTKIAWYLYPALPQFFFLAFYPLIIIKKPQWISLGVTLFLTFFLIRNALFKNNLLTTFYSQNDPHIQITQIAARKCQNLIVLVPDYTRNTYATLKKLNLVISTTNWWGEHPSMVYYFNNQPLFFSYSAQEFSQKIEQFQCSIVDQKDIKLSSGKRLARIGQYYLFIKR